MKIKTYKNALNNKKSSKQTIKIWSLEYGAYDITKLT